jgi:hypothetical protein
MTEMKLPIVIQTKGGYGIDEVLEFLPKSVWYISIGHNDDSTRKKVEPAAPSIESRIELCDRLVKAGHKVTVGINPVLEEWLPEPEKLCKTLGEIGVWGCWIETLHLNYKQLREMHPKHKEALGEPIIESAMKRNAPQHVVNHYLRTRKAVQDAGMWVYSGIQCNYSEFFEWGDCYETTYPTEQGFVNHLITTGQEFVTYEDWRNYFLPRLPDIGRQADIRKYITSQNQEWNLPFKIISKPSFGHIFLAAWKCEKIKMGAFYDNLGIAKVRENGEIVRCKDGFPVLHFNPDGNSIYVDLE